MPSMHDPTDVIFAEVTTEPAAISYLQTLIDECRQSRRTTMSPLATTKDALFFYMRYGRCLGALTTLMHTRTITESTYRKLHQEVIGLATEQVIATV